MRLFHLCTAASALLLSTTSASAGPTVAADLDLGTSTRSTPPGGTASIYPTPSPLYTVGFALRAGWRFDVAPVWFLPEIGAGYAVEHLTQVPTATAPESPHVARVFGGGRIGWSGAIRPELRFEPSIFGHVGAGWYGASTDGTAFDVGLSLDLRIRQHVIVGAQVGYDVVTVWHPGGSPACQPMTVLTPTGPVTLPCSSPAATPAVADPWVSYGVHAGWLFW